MERERGSGVLFKDLYELREDLGKYVVRDRFSIFTKRIPWSPSSVCYLSPFLSYTSIFFMIKGCIQCCKEMCVSDKWPAVCCQDYQQEETDSQRLVQKQ